MLSRLVTRGAVAAPRFAREGATAPGFARKGAGGVGWTLLDGDVLLWRRGVGAPGGVGPSGGGGGDGGELPTEPTLRLRPTAKPCRDL